MVFTPEQGLEEREPKVRRMTTNMQQMEANIAKMKRDFEMDTWRIFRQFLTTLAIGVGAGIGLATYVEHHNPQVTQSQGKP